MASETNIDSNGPYEVMVDDLDGLPQDATVAQRREYEKEVKRYALEMLAALKDTTAKGESLWLDFVVTFRPHTVRELSNRIANAWCDFLRSRDIFVARDCNMPYKQRLLYCLTQEKFIPHWTAQHDSSSRVVELEILPRKDDTINENKFSISGNGSNVGTPEINTSKIYQSRFLEGNHQRLVREPTRSNDCTTRSLGIHGLMKAFTGRKKFSGVFDEDLNSCLEVYEIMARMCHFTDAQKAEGFPIMLKDDALNYYLTTSNTDDSLILL